MLLVHSGVLQNLDLKAQCSDIWLLPCFFLYKKLGTVLMQFES